MKLPKGLKEALGINIDESEDCVLLKKTLYGLVQAARRWWKMIITTLKQIGFLQCKVDTCLLIRKNDYGMVILCVYVDDILMVGDKRGIAHVTEELKAHFAVKRSNEVTEYVGCGIEKIDNGMRLHQPDIIAKIERKFDAELKKIERIPKTPARTGGIVVRPDDNAILLDDKLQERYRSGVGMLLYLIKHSRPDLANAVRELSKVMDGATTAHYKDMMRTIKYVVETKDKGLLMIPKND